MIVPTFRKTDNEDLAVATWISFALAIVAWMIASWLFFETVDSALSIFIAPRPMLWPRLQQWWRGEYYYVVWWFSCNVTAMYCLAVFRAGRREQIARLNVPEKRKA